MSLKYFIRICKGTQEEYSRFEKVVWNFVAYYLMVACVWAICYLVGEILQKMGVA